MKRVLVIGSGIVGLCSGIELIERGYSVTIIDPNEPGSQTYGVSCKGLQRITNFIFKNTS